MKTSSSILPTVQFTQPKASGAATQKSAWQAVLRLASSNYVLALADQAVASGTSFLTLIMIARWTDGGQLGVFAIANSLLGMAVAIQHSLISQPYTIQRHGLQGRAGERACCSLIQSALLSAAGVCVLIVAALILSSLSVAKETIQTVWALAVLVPFIMAKELVREFAFAHLRLSRALFLDGATASIQFAVLGWLAMTGRMSVLAAFGAIGISCGTVAVASLYLTRGDFVFRVVSSRSLLMESWHLGKWLSLSKLAVLVQGYATYWLSAAIAGAAVTGIYAACMSVISLVNPLLMGLYNFLAPRSVLAWKDGGGPSLKVQTVKDTILLGAMMCSFGIFIFLGGETVMRWLYPNTEYQGYGQVLAVLAMAMLVSSVGIPASNALATMERSRAAAAVAGISALINVASVWLLMTKFGLLGAAFGLLAGNLAWTLGRWAVFLMLLPKAVEGASTKVHACGA